MMAYDVFISYAKEDQRIAEGICSYLEARGIRCFVDYRDVPQGFVRARAVVEGLEHSKVMVAVFTDSYNSSLKVDREIEIAAEDNKPIITYKISSSRFTGAKRYYLAAYNCINASSNTASSKEEFYKKLCGLLGIVYVSNPQPPTNQNSNFQGQKDSIKNVDLGLVFDPLTGEFKPRNASTSQNANRSDNGLINGHAYVDLGLPSGLKWATCNIGARAPEEFGDYFAWGQTSKQTQYSRDKCPAFSKDNDWLRRNGFIDGRGNLVMSHDLCRQQWGGTWRMPTQAELEELVKNTTTRWITQNGVNGRLVISKINGKSIFFPAAGWRDGVNGCSAGQRGYCWGSTPNVHDSWRASYICFYSGDFEVNWSDRFLGRSARAVSE